VFDCSTSLVFNTEILLDVIKEIGHEANVAKIEYTTILISCAQISEQNHYMTVVIICCKMWCNQVFGTNSYW